MSKIKYRPYANAICNLFESLLDEYGIDIPDEDRDFEMKHMTKEEIEEAGFAHLYGEAYFYLEDAVSELLVKFVKEIDQDGNVELVDGF